MLFAHNAPTTDYSSIHSHRLVSLRLQAWQARRDKTVRGPERRRLIEQEIVAVTWRLIFSRWAAGSLK